MPDFYTLETLDEIETAELSQALDQMLAAPSDDND
jgi:hypothetical protein